MAKTKSISNKNNKTDILIAKLLVNMKNDSRTCVYIKGIYDNLRLGPEKDQNIIKHKDDLEKIILFIKDKIKDFEKKITVNSFFLLEEYFNIFHFVMESFYLNSTFKLSVNNVEDIENVLCNLLKILHHLKIQYRLERSIFYQLYLLLNSQDDIFLFHKDENMLIALNTIEKHKNINWIVYIGIEIFCFKPIFMQSLEKVAKYINKYTTLSIFLNVFENNAFKTFLKNVNAPKNICEKVFNFIFLITSYCIIYKNISETLMTNRTFTILLKLMDNSNNEIKCTGIRIISNLMRGNLSDIKLFNKLLLYFVNANGIKIIIALLNDVDWVIYDYSLLMSSYDILFSLTTFSNEKYKKDLLRNGLIKIILKGLKLYSTKYKPGTICYHTSFLKGIIDDDYTQGDFTNTELIMCENPIPIILQVMNDNQSEELIQVNCSMLLSLICLDKDNKTIKKNIKKIIENKDNKIIERNLKTYKESKHFYHFIHLHSMLFNELNEDSTKNKTQNVDERSKSRTQSRTQDKSQSKSRSQRQKSRSRTQSKRRDKRQSKDRSQRQRSQSRIKRQNNSNSFFSKMTNWLS